MEQKKWIALEECRFETKFKDILSSMFTPQQIDLILNRKKKVYKWEPRDIASSITLRSISPKAYRYLRNTLDFPLPGILNLYSFVVKLYYCMQNSDKTFDFWKFDNFNIYKLININSLKNCFIILIK